MTTTHPNWAPAAPVAPRIPAQPVPGSFGDLAARAIRSKGISQAAVARACCISRTNLNHLLAGRKNPGIRTLVRLIDVLPEHREALVTAALEAARQADRGGRG